MVHTLQIAFLCFAFLFIFFVYKCVECIVIAFLHDLTLFWSFFLIPLCLLWICYNSHSVALCSHCVCLRLFVFFFSFHFFYIYIYFILCSSLVFFCFWFLHHLLFFFQFFLFLVRCVWVNELLCFDAFHSRCLAKPWCKGKQKRPNCKSNLSFYTYIYIYRHQSISWFGIYEWTREYGERKSRINIDFVCVSFAFCHSAFSSSSVFCFVYFVCLFVVCFGAHMIALQVFSFSLCNHHLWCGNNVSHRQPTDNQPDIQTDR